MLTPYCSLDVIAAFRIKKAMLLDICLNEEGGGSWIEGEGQLEPPVLAHFQTWTAP
jgi:hypothetical protein